MTSRKGTNTERQGERKRERGKDPKKVGGALKAG